MANKKRGFTLIELLIVIAVLGVLATVTLVIINPARQLAKARDSERRTHLFSILSAVYNYNAEHSGALPDTDGDPETSNFPVTPTCIGTGAGCFNLASAGEDGDTIVPVYLPSIPQDPKTGDTTNSGYFIYVDSYDRLHASAVGETVLEIAETR